MIEPLDSHSRSTFKVLMFLKWHDGLGNLMTFNYRWTVFGFFWLSLRDEGESATNSTQEVELILRAYRKINFTFAVVSASTLGFLKRASKNDFNLIRQYRFNKFNKYLGSLKALPVSKRFSSDAACVVAANILLDWLYRKLRGSPLLLVLRARGNQDKDDFRPKSRPTEVGRLPRKAEPHLHRRAHPKR